MTYPPRSAAHSAPPGAQGGAISVRDVTKRFGGVVAVDDLSFDLVPGSATAIIGPNGAGKSTVLKMISGVYRPTSGDVEVAGSHITKLRPHQVARAGIGFAHQVPRPFHGLSMAQNVEVAIAASGSGADLHEILELTDLERISARRPTDLGVLDLKRLEVARALASNPSVVLLDEIAAGLVGRDLDDAIELVRAVHQRGVTVLLVEHVEAVVRSLVDRVLVLDWGKLIADGTPEQISADPKVRAVYLGEAESHTAEPAAYAAAPVNALLAARDLTVAYAGTRVVRNVDLAIGEGEVVALLGANGAGKSTLCSALSGLVPAESGHIELDGESIDSLPAFARNRSGISHCPEGRRLFVELSVLENLELGAPLRLGRKELADRTQEVCAIFPALEGKLHDRAGSLSGGQQQMVAVARALMSKPRLLICDEVSLGLAPLAIDALYEGLDRVRQQGCSILIVEQNVHRCLSFANRAYVLNRGRLSFAGDPGDLADPKTLDDAYFGTSSEASAPSATP